MKNKCLTEEEIARYIDGLASDVEQHQVVQHCKSCSDCADEVATLLRFHSFTGLEKYSIGNLPSPDKTQIIEDSFSSQSNLHISFNPLSMAASTLDNNSKINIFNQDQSGPIKNSYLSTSKNTCAIKAQRIILNSLGIFIDEEQLTNEAINHGWYTPSKGTLLTDCGKLLELYGISTLLKINVTIDEVIAELQKGNKIIVGVDSGELRAQTDEELLLERLEDEIMPIPDHVLIVLDINLSDPDNKKVLVKDTTDNEAIKEYPLIRFLDAWQDSDFFMIIALLTK